MLFFIPRFYQVVNKDNYNFKLNDEKNNKKYYIDTDSDGILESKKLCVYYDESHDGDFVNIEENYYFRPKWDASRDWVKNNICFKFNITDDDGHTMFQSDIDELLNVDDNDASHTSDIYFAFRTFNDFKNWLNKDKTMKLVWRVLPEGKYDLDAHKEMYLQYIQNHFKTNIGNILLLKMRFDGEEHTL